jgi:type VI secretion system protein ImpF
MVLVKQETGARALLFDMLVDEHPGQLSESNPFRFFTVEKLQQSIMKEVTDLLNTRRSFLKFDDVVWRSTLAYGIGDHAGASINSENDKALIAEDIQKTVKRFEPRLIGVTVEVSEIDSSSESLIVIIHATLKAGKINQQFSFQVAIGSEPQGE